MLSAWRGLFTLLPRHHVLLGPVVGIRAPKAARKSCRALSPDQMAQLLQPADEEDALSLRDVAMFELFIPPACACPNCRAEPGCGRFRRRQKCDAEQRATRAASCRGRAAGAGGASQWLPLRNSLAAADRPALFVDQRATPVGARHPATAATAGAEAGKSTSAPSACAAPFVRQPPAAIVRRPARGAGNARPRQHHHHADLHHLDFQYLAKSYDAAHPRAKRKD